MIPPIPSASSQLVTCIDHRIQPLLSRHHLITIFTDRLSLLNIRETKNSFLPTITLPTRWSNNSSLIDNIFVNYYYYISLFTQNMA